MNWCKVKTVYRRQKLLSEQARKPGGRINSLMIEHEEEEEERPAASADDLPSEATQWLIDHINKLGGAQSKGKGTGKGPRGKGKGKGVRIQFEGC